MQLPVPFRRVARGVRELLGARDAMDVPIGAWLDGRAVEFRVWAPHADAVDVVLQRGVRRWTSGAASWSEPMSRRDDGYWRVRSERAAPGDLYRYQVRWGGRVCWRLDPAARHVVHSELPRFRPDSENAGILPGPDRTQWITFTRPAAEDYRIYQLHVGSWVGRNDGSNVREVAGFDDARRRLPHVADLGFNAIALLPVHEFAADRSWGYNPAAFYSPESAYGTPGALRGLVSEAHRMGLAVIFDVVYNHAGPGDNVLWGFDGEVEGGIYFEGGPMTHWGPGPAWWKREVQHFFYQNARMYLDDYRADGLRFDATTQIDGIHLAPVVHRLKRRYPDRYFVAEHLPAHPWVTRECGFDATWVARSHHESQRAFAGDRPVDRLCGLLGWDGFEHAHNRIHYILGCHDDCGDMEAGDAENGLDNWDRRHRYLVDLFGGRHSADARAICRLAWALNVTMPGTPMMFMGSECHMGAPSVAWGYWHDGADAHGDHRFDWAVASDDVAMPMRRFVAAANALRESERALRGDTLEITHTDHENGVLAFERWRRGRRILVVLHVGTYSFERGEYKTRTRGAGPTFKEVLCSQDPEFGGWEGAGNGGRSFSTDGEGRISVNLPARGALVFVSS